MPKVLTDDDVAVFRERICDVAEGLFASQGLDGVTVRALADAVGCSRMTPYRYFVDKADILATVRARGFRRLGDAMDRASQEESDPFLVLGALGRAYLRFAREEPDAYRLMYAISQGDENRYPDLVTQIRRSQQALVLAVRTAAREGLVVGDPLDVVHVLWAGLHGLNTLYLADKLHLGRSIDDLGEMMIISLGHAVTADTKGPQR